MTLIKGRAIVTNDTWSFVDDDAPLPNRGDVVVSLERFMGSSELTKHDGRVGLRLRSEQLAEDAAQHLEGIALVAIEFPKFTDGRGYSTARLLRERFGFQGELRAIGHVLRDQLLYMARCGFDSFELTAGKDAEGALEAFREFDFTYQAAVDEPRPLYRRGVRG